MSRREPRNPGHSGVRPLLGLLLVLATLAIEPRHVRGQNASADPLTAFVGDLQRAIASGRSEALDALTSSRLPAEDVLTFLGATSAGSAVSVRERARFDSGDLILDVFVDRGTSGRLATWHVGTRRGVTRPVELSSLREVGAFGDLVKLELDTSQALRLRNFSFTAPDLTLDVPDGVTFVTRGRYGITGLVLLGRGTVRFTPRTRTEQRQMEIFAGTPALATTIDEAFIRVKSDEFETLVNQGALEATQARDGDVRRAREIFREYASRSFAISVGDMSEATWSLEPPAGGVVVEFHSTSRSWLTYTRTPQDLEDVALFDRAKQRFISAYTSNATLHQRRDNPGSELPVFDVTHYDVRVDLDPERSWISGTASLVLERDLEESPLLTFKLAESLAVTSVSSPTLGQLFSMRVVGRDQIIVNVPTRERSVTLVFEYSGRLAPQAAEREAAAVNARDQDAERGNSAANQPSERFLYSTRRAWYPQSRAPDFATARLEVRVPRPFSSVASGRRRDTPEMDPASARSDSPDRHRSVFVAEQPVRYLAVAVSRWGSAAGATSVAVPALEAPSVPGGATPHTAVVIDTVGTPGQISRNRDTSTRVADIVAFYAATLGDAPYPSLTIAAADDTRPGGHAPAFFALVQQPLPGARITWANDPVAFDNFPDFFLAHEVAHQWWGQAVGWKTYHDQWLSEGLAQFFAALYLEHSRGRNAADQLFASMRRSALRAEQSGPISLGYRIGQIEGDPRAYRAVLYNKSALVLDMLRRLMGDERFFNGLRTFYREWRFRNPGTDDVRAAFERHSAVPLERFFERWIDGSASPRVRVTSQISTGGPSASVRIEQIGEVFDFPLDISIHYVDGRTEVVTLLVTADTSTHPLVLSGTPRRIAVRDPRTMAVW